MVTTTSRQRRQQQTECDNTQNKEHNAKITVHRSANIKYHHRPQRTLHAYHSVRNHTQSPH